MGMGTNVAAQVPGEPPHALALRRAQSRGGGGRVQKEKYTYDMI